MKIAYLSGSTFPSRAANSVHVSKMCEALTKAGHYVTLFAFSSSDENISIKDSYDISHLFDTVFIRKNIGKRLKSWIVSFQLARKISAFDFDIIYSRNRLSTLFINRNSDFVFEAHSFPISILSRLCENTILRRKKLKALIVITEALKQEYVKNFPFLADKILVASDGANDVPFFESDILRCSTVGYVGHLYEGRGIEIVVELARMFPDLNFLVVGGEDKQVNSWRERCDKMTNINFVGYVPHAILGDYYKEMDIVLSPHQKTVTVHGGGGDISKWTSPLKLFEYMSYRKPMIVSNLPVFHEILKDEETCLFCEPDDINSWRIQLERLIKDEYLRRKLGEQAYDNFINNYTWDARVKKIIEHIENRL